MLVVRVELWPGRDPRVLRQIEALTIERVGRTPGGRYRYEVRMNGRRVIVRHRAPDRAIHLVAVAIRALEKAGAIPESSSASEGASFPAGSDGP